MRRADRLFQIVQILRMGRLVKAVDLAARLEVSERTIYRDMRDLMSSGVPIDGEAGVGYVMRRGYDLPPLMFTREETEALAVAARLLRSWAGGAIGAAASSALDKIESAMPEARRAELVASRLFAPEFAARPETRDAFDIVHRAINARRVLAFSYTRADGEASGREVRPLGLFFWGKEWTLAAWCELRGDYRNFRVDRMADLVILERGFVETPESSLAGFLRKVGQES